MILTCPQCATRYLLADDRIGPEGRTVKCARCGEVWRPQTEEPPMAEAEAQVAAPEPQVQTAADPAPAAEPPSDPPALEADSGRALAQRRAAEQRRRQERAQRRADGLRVAGVILVLLVILLLAAVVALQPQVISQWPAATKAYVAMGLRRPAAAATPPSRTPPLPAVRPARP